MNETERSAWSKEVGRAREKYVDTVTDATVAFLRSMGVYLDENGETALADAIRFHSK